jgi:hypothetical protein
MLGRLVGQGLTNKRLERDSRSKRVAQVYLMIAEKTGTEPAVSGETNTVTG